ncbi:MAG: glucose-1-phosphate adenylyltransferase [FCB group bacterium]|jgi:glucose-1-phosphate adenylyltransferase|nr:glucose-1-phosphate adenylyltransferase [FCB group bacterium]
MIQRNIDWGMQEEMQMAVALVLGGGRGTRLYPLTSERAKPAVPFGGRYRLIDIPLSNCIHSGINRIFVLTQFNSASLNRHISSTYAFDAFGGGFVEILAAEQTREYGDWFQGTADAVRKHMRHFRNMRISHYLILSGDQLYGMDYRQLMTTHMAQEADITVAVLPVTKEAARGFGILKVDEEGRIREFVEKPRAEEEFTQLVTPQDVLEKYGLAELDKRQYLASMGVYVIKAEVLETILNERRDWIDFGKDVIPKSLKTHRVYTHPFLGYWEDIGTVRSYYEVSLQLVRPDPPFEFKSPDHEVYTHPRHLPGSRVNNATIKDSFLCEGTCVHSKLVENSIIGIRSILQPDSEIRNSIIMGSDYYEYECPTPQAIPVGVGRGSRITQAIIDKNARIGQNVVIEGADHLHDADGEGWSIRDGIVIVLKNAIIADGTKIGAAAEAAGAK